MALGLFDREWERMQQEMRNQEMNDRLRNLQGQLPGDIHWYRDGTSNSLVEPRKPKPDPKLLLLCK